MTIQELEQFIATYGTDIYSFCVYLTGNRPEAEELYQDTFLKTLELLDKIQKDGNPKSYLLSVAIRIWKIGTGKYEIVYGAESQYMKCISRVMLEMDGLVYCINYRGVYPNWDKYGAEGLGQMAAEIIRAGE